MNRETKRHAMRIARELREEFRADGEFRQSAYKQCLAERLRVMDGEAFEGFVDAIADAVDKDTSSSATTRQPDIPGLCFDLGGEYRLGDDRRIAKRLAQLRHAEDALAIDDENLLAVQEANMRKRRELMALRDYWGPGMTKEQAVAAYQEANPSTGVA